jgi:hypothetical protein
MRIGLHLKKEKINQEKYERNDRRKNEYGTEENRGISQSG